MSSEQNVHGPKNGRLQFSLAMLLIAVTYSAAVFAAVHWGLFVSQTGVLVLIAGLMILATKGRALPAVVVSGLTTSIITVPLSFDPLASSTRLINSWGGPLAIAAFTGIVCGGIAPPFALLRKRPVASSD